MLVLSVVVLLRGHNEPGRRVRGRAARRERVRAARDGVRRLDEARKTCASTPRVLIGVGLLLGARAACRRCDRRRLPQGVVEHVPVPGFPEAVKAGTPLVFDIGVYLLVLGPLF
jgi:multicomponent Na+:H+ antiporter subunit B